MNMLRSLENNWRGAVLAMRIFILFLAATPPARPQPVTTTNPWSYLLLDESYLIDDCLICGRPTIQVPMRGTFELQLLENGPLFTRYAVKNISFQAGGRYKVTGSGTYEFGGEFALMQRMSLQVQIDDGFSNKLCYFTNTSPAVTRSLPMFDVTLDQTNGTLIQTYQLRLAAAPVRELWFSTASGLTSAHSQPPTNGISAGDLLSSVSRVVKRNHELTGPLGIMPIVPDLGLDAVDILPGGEIAFSVEQDVFSETRGPLHHGDLRSNRGSIIRRNQDLLAPFVPQPPASDVGLDAVQVLDSGDILFSIEKDFFSERLGVTLRRGDLLSATGQVVRSNQQLLSRFHPADATKDYGLDALYLWPHGEIWFSTENGFQDLTLGSILAGDLLSDRGYIVFRNLELLNPFAPVEDLADFGLDALYVVTDATPPVPVPRFTSIQANRSSGNVQLMWQGSGRVFQVERAAVLPGTFQPLSPIIPDLFFDDPGTLSDRSQAYYRLRQW